MPIKTLSLRNYGVFRNAEFLGLSPLTIIVGANGAGKSTLFDVFSFLKDALSRNVHAAVMARGGFGELVSRGEEGPIEIIVGYTGRDDRRLVYALSLVEDRGRVVVDTEQLRSEVGDSERFLNFKRGQGSAVRDEEGYRNEVTHKLTDASTLAVGVLGLFTDFPLVLEFRSLIERWHISNFLVANSRPSTKSVEHEHLSPNGDNLAQVLQHIRECHPKVFQQVLDALRHRVPGVDSVETKATRDDRLVLCFKEGGFERPFLGSRASDGTLKMLAYLLLLHDPAPHPLLAVEEPEGHLYPGFLGHLAEEFRYYARRGGQALVTTQSYEFLNEARLDEVFWLVKKDCFSTPHRARDSELLRNLHEEGDPLGALWRQRLFKGVDP